MLAPDSDDDVLVTFDLAAAPYVVEPHGAGFRLYIRDMKDLAQEDTNFLLAILGVTRLVQVKRVNVPEV